MSGNIMYTETFPIEEMASAKTNSLNKNQVNGLCIESEYNNSISNKIFDTTIEHKNQ